MITSKEAYIAYLKADQLALGTEKTSLLRELIFPNKIWQFQRQLRKLEYRINCKKGGILNKLIKLVVIRRFNQLSYELGFSIPPNVFGPGLSIAHYGSIVVNGHAKVGRNCRIHVGVNIGTLPGHEGLAPQIGDNVYIGPGAKIYGAIVVPDGCAIGANAVVNRTFTEQNILIAGIPAKRIKEVDTSKFLTVTS